MNLTTKIIKKRFAEDLIISNKGTWGMGEIKQGNNIIYISKDDIRIVIEALEEIEKEDD